MADLIAVDWGDRGGNCCEFWQVEPCCGSPWNPIDCLYCFACWCIFPLNIMSTAKLYAHSQGRDCACWNHCALACIAHAGGVPQIALFSGGAAPLLCTSMRYNLRTQAGMGLPMADNWGVLGDCIMMLGCPCCTTCQLLRSAGTKESWDWVQELKNKGCKCYEPPCVFFRPIAHDIN